MKWYCCINEAGLAGGEPLQLLQVALKSCLRHTALKPHLIYTGDDQANLQALEEAGFTVIRHNPSLEPALRFFYGARYAQFCGHWLRVDIPDIERDEDYVLYTDIDVMFLRDAPYQTFRPSIIACAPEHHQDDFSYFNSGTMVINVPACRGLMQEFRALVCGRIARAEMHADDHDQVNLNLFFKDRWERLPNNYNWKPYWGVNEGAAIVHFHGPKPGLARAILGGKDLDLIEADWKVIVARNPAGYEHFLAVYQNFVERPEQLSAEAAKQAADAAQAKADQATAEPIRPSVVAEPRRAAGLALFHEEKGLFLLRGRGADDPGLVVPFGGARAAAYPVAGDWEGAGVAGLGVYLPKTGEFVVGGLTEDSRRWRFRFGPPDCGWLPVAGDWDGDGKHSVGLYDPLAGSFFLRNGLLGGDADLAFRFGPERSGYLPVAGDWEGTGRYSVGLYDPLNARFMLRRGVEEDDTGVTVLDLGLAQAGEVFPLAGDWEGSGRHSVGLYSRQSATFELHYREASGRVECIHWGLVMGQAIPLAIPFGAGPLSLPG